MSTYTGSTAQEALIKAMMDVCQPCNDCGSGSGSGSGTGIDVCCCQWCATCGLSPYTFSGPTSLTVSINVGCIGTRTYTLNQTASPCNFSVSAGKFYEYTSGTVTSGACGRCDTIGSTLWFDEPDYVALWCNTLDGIGSTLSWSLQFRMYSTTAYVIGQPYVLVQSCSPYYATATDTVVCSGIGGLGGTVSICNGCVGSAVTIEVTQ